MLELYNNDRQVVIYTNVIHYMYISLPTYMYSFIGSPNQTTKVYHKWQWWPFNW